METTLQDFLRKWNPSTSHPRYSSVDMAEMAMACGVEVAKNTINEKTLYIDRKDVDTVIGFVDDSTVNKIYEKSVLNGVLIASNSTCFKDKFIIITCIDVDSDVDSHLLEIDIFGDAKSVKNLMKKLKPFLQKTTPMVEWATNVSQSGIIAKEIPFKTPYPIFDELYPNLEYGIEDFFKSFEESEATVLLLYGQHGMGKTNLVDNLIWQSKKGCLITYNDDVARSDELFTHYMDSDKNYLLIEDADLMLQDRQDGNNTLKKILNISDGIVSNKHKKFVFTTNLSSLNKIDEALLRPGRCFATIKFEKYNYKQSALICEKLGIDSKLLDSKDSWTLAEIFSLTNGNSKYNKARYKPKMGF